jgi:hypothetical protein
MDEAMIEPYGQRRGERLRVENPGALQSTGSASNPPQWSI